MRFKLTILLLILNLGLFSLIFYIDRAQSTRNAFESSSRLILEPAFVQGLDRIRISSTTTQAEWEIRRTDPAGWTITAPINWKANPFAVQQLLFRLQELSWESRFPVDDLPAAGQSLETYNLQDPPLRIELFNGEQSQVLDLGAPTEIGNRLYTISPDGRYVLVIPRTLVEMLQRNLDSFLDRRIFGLGIEGSRVIQIQDRSSSNIRVRLERREAGWRFVSPIEAEADAERVQAMIAEWQDLEAQGFETSADASLEINGNVLRLTFEGLNERETLLLAPLPQGDAPLEWYLAKREAYGAVFRVPAAPVEELRRAQEALREKRVLLRDADAWNSLKIQFGDLSTTLQQLENGQWQVLYTDDAGALRSQPADPGALAEVRSLLGTLEAVRFVSDAPSETDLARFGLNAPQRRLTLKKASGETVELLIGGLAAEETSTLLYAMSSRSASVFLVRPHALAGLPLNPMHWRDRTIRSLPDTAEIESVRLLDRQTGSDLLESGRLPAEARAALQAELAAYARKVQVGRYLADSFTDPMHLDRQTQFPWPYQLEVTVRYPSAQADDGRALVLFISNRLGGTSQYVGDPDSGLVGTLPAPLIEALDPLLVTFPEDPGSPPVEPESQPPEPPAGDAGETS